jgi:peptidyl-prolyl cis-trans isomerase C
MVKPFADAVAAMEKGSYTKEPVQTQFGWHVILLEDTRETEAPTLDSVRGEIITKLQQQVLADYMQQLRGNSEIVFNEQMAAEKSADDAADKPQSGDENQTAEKPAEDTQAEAATADENAKPATE